MGEPNQFKPTAARILLAFAITVALIAVFTAVEASRRAEMEGYDFPTGLNDPDWFDPEAAEYHPEVPICELGGKPIYRRKRRPGDRYDKYMYKVGREDGDRFYLYKYQNPRRGVGTVDGIYYVKIGPGSYIEVGDEPKPPEPLEPDPLPVPEEEPLPVPEPATPPLP